MNKNGLLKLAQHLKYLKSEAEESSKLNFDVEYLIHSRVNILFLAVIAGFNDFMNLCLDWFDYKYDFYQLSFDPLEHALSLNNKQILDAFADYFRCNISKFSQDQFLNPIFGERDELFFAVLSSKSEKLKRFVLENFMTPGRSQLIELPSTFPLKGEKDFKIIPYGKFTRDQRFKKKMEKEMKHGIKIREKEVDYLTSEFSINLSINSSFTTNLLKFLEDYQDRVFDTYLRCIVREIWKKNLLIYCLYSLLSWTSTIGFILGTVWFKNHVWLTFFVTILEFMLAFYEFRVASKNLKAYISSKVNMLDIYLVFSIPLIMFLNTYDHMNDSDRFFNLVSSMTMFLSAARSSTYLRVINPLRYLIAMIIEVFFELKWFLVLLFWSILVLGAIEVQVLKTTGEFEGHFHEWLKTLDVLYNLAHGDWDGSLEYNFNQYVQFLINTILLPLVMLNFLIAIIVKTHDNFHESKEFTDYRETIELLTEMNYFTRGLFHSGD